MNLDQAFNTFLEESRELLADLERYLLELEADPNDSELLNALFRCVHTVKGAAGIFALDHVVAFTHVVENVLDRLRAGTLGLDAELAALLLKCRDHIDALIERPSADQLDEPLRASDAALLAALAQYQEGGEAAVAPVPVQAAAPKVEVSGGGVVGGDTWHISLRFAREVLAHGMDPISFIRYLGQLGELRYVTTLSDALPAGDDFDPESCYLGFEIELYSEADKATIEGVFDFVRELCQLRILPPRSRLSEYMQLIRELPEGPQRLGEILVASGALTEAELAEGLRLQQEQRQREDAAKQPIGEVLVAQGVVQPELVSAALSKQKQSRERQAQASRYLRVQADKLDRLINLVGELVIASASVGLNAAKSGDADTQEAAAAMSLLVEEIRDSTLQLRMVPIGETFSRYQRVVRDVAAELGKDIALVISGADTELDKSVVEKISEPLTHLVRNACDHGIESAERRLELGKPAQGTVRLNAYHESGAIVIEVSDDGGGLNAARIRAKALERGLIRPDQTLSEQEIFQLVFEPGFSTAATVTNLSGRGVGMDVVKRSIEALRGTVELLSSPGQGTTCRIRLPLTLAIIDGFLCRVGDASYVVPLEMVVECIEFSASETEGRDIINLRGEVLPFVRLRDYFGVDGAVGRRQNIIVVQYAGQKAGLVVDELLGEHQTVIKPLGPLFAYLKGISGSTILGNGQVALIVDVPALIGRLTQHDDALAGRRLPRTGAAAALPAPVAHH